MITRPSIRAFQSLWRPRNIETRSSLRPGSTMTRNDRMEYNWIDGVETLEKYQPGGYHPVMIGDLLHDRYRIADKLGSGGYSNQYVAIKVNVSDSRPRESQALKALPASVSSRAHPGRELVSTLRDKFHIQGPNGTHLCYTMAPARCNLREISFSRLFPLDVARALAYGIAQAVAYTHSQGYVHGGLSQKPRSCIRVD